MLSAEVRCDGKLTSTTLAAWLYFSRVVRVQGACALSIYLFDYMLYILCVHIPIYIYTIQKSCHPSPKTTVRTLSTSPAYAFVLTRQEADSTATDSIFSLVDSACCLHTGPLEKAVLISSYLK